MSFWKTIVCRWSEDELKKWPAIKKTAYMLLPFFLYIVVYDVSEVVLWALMEFFISSNGGVPAFLYENVSTVQGLGNGLAILIGVLAIRPAVINELQWKENTGQEKNKRADVKRQWINAEKLTGYAFLAALAFCAAVSLNIFFYQTGFTGSSQAYGEVQKVQYGVRFLTGMILYGVISPLAEEAVFRVLIYNRMKRCFGFTIALIVSSFLFGVYHGNPVQAVYGTILGLLIAYTYELYESFAAPLLFHAVANISVYAMTYQTDQAFMNRKTALITGAVTFAAAILLLLFIKKKLLKKEKQPEIV